MPKELISRFVKLCPTCQVRRGTSRNSPESPPSPEAKAAPLSPGTYSITASRRNSTASGHTTPVASLPLQTAGFKTTPTFQQQNRWMAPMQPQSELNHTSPSSIHNPTGRHDSYNTNNIQTGLSFSSINSYGSTTGSSNAYTSSSLSQSAHGHVPAGSAYNVKLDARYL